MPLTYEDVPRTAGERETLTSFLDWQRATLQRKCDGLTAHQLRIRAAAPSTLSLLGIVRHMADVERWWFRINVAGEDLPLRYSSDAAPDDDFDDIGAAPPEAVFAAWHEECDRAREVVDARQLDDSFHHRRSGRVTTLRWTLVHMIEEYSRHNGHADLLRQRIDGATGY